MDNRPNSLILHQQEKCNQFVKVRIQAPFRIDQQPFLAFLQPTLAVPAGQTSECVFFFFTLASFSKSEVLPILHTVSVLGQELRLHHSVHSLRGSAGEVLLWKRSHLSGLAILWRLSWQDAGD